MSFKLYLLKVESLGDCGDRYYFMYNSENFTKQQIIDLFTRKYNIDRLKQFVNFSLHNNSDELTYYEISIMFETWESCYDEGFIFEGTDRFNFHCY